jgi:hypothetical protein
MRLVKFDDVCTISRKEGIDKYDNEINTVVYNGHCLYQEESVLTAQGVTVRRATVSIPEDVQVNINDSIVVYKVKGEDISAVVEHSVIVKMPVTGEMITQLEIKRGV